MGAYEKVSQEKTPLH